MYVCCSEYGQQLATEYLKKPEVGFGLRSPGNVQRIRHVYPNLQITDWAFVSKHCIIPVLDSFNCQSDTT